MVSHSVFRSIFPEQPVVSPVQSYTVIVSQPGKVNHFVQAYVMLRFIQLKAKSFHVIKNKKE